MLKFQVDHASFQGGEASANKKKERTTEYGICIVRRDVIASFKSLGDTSNLISMVSFTFTYHYAASLYFAGISAIYLLPFVEV